MEKDKMEEKINDFTCLIKAINDGDILYYHKALLSLEEAAQYTGIGINKLRNIVNDHPDLTLLNGNRHMIKRMKLEKYLENQYSI